MPWLRCLNLGSSYILVLALPTIIGCSSGANAANERLHDGENFCQAERIRDILAPFEDTVDGKILHSPSKSTQHL